MLRNKFLWIKFTVLLGSVFRKIIIIIIIIFDDFRLYNIIIFLQHTHHYKYAANIVLATPPL